VTLHRFEETINGRAYEIEVSAVRPDRWRAYLVNLAGGPTALMPFYAVQILFQLANQDIPIASDNIKAGISGVPAYIDTGVIIVDERNYEFFLRD